MVFKSITVIHLFFLSWVFVVVPGTAFGEVLLDDGFEAGLNLGVWDVRPNRGKQWIHAVEPGNGYITAQPIPGSPFSQIHRFTQLITHQTDFTDFEMTWDMRYDNSGTHRDHRHVHFRSVWDQVTIPRGLSLPSTQGYFVWTGVNIPGTGSIVAIGRRNPDGYNTWLSPGLGYPWQVGVWYSHRLKVEGNEFKYKAWQRGSPEPGAWTLTATDPDAIYNQGGVGFGNYWAASTRVDNVTVAMLSMPPTAVAGPNQSIHAGEPVQLDGSGSYDDVTPTENLTYDWNFVAIPAGSTAVLSGANTITPSFIADLPGSYDVSLVVTDEDGLLSDPSQVSISSFNTPPNANAGADKASYVGNLLTLDGTGSNDPDDDLLTYSWVLLNKPAGSTAQLNDAFTAAPTIEPDLPGSYDIELIVNDGFVDSLPDNVTLVIITAEDFAQQQTAETINLVTALPPTSVSTSGNQQALTNFLIQAIDQLQNDKIDNAISKLVNAIERTDGCALRGSPDLSGSGGIKKDYVTNCSDQTLIYQQLINALEALQ